MLLICVPTPLTAHLEPDLSFIEQTGRTIARHLRRGQLVILESTTYPGTTTEVLRPILEASGLVCNRDFFLAFSPEREDPGNIEFSTSKIPKVVGADDPAAQEAAMALYSHFVTADCCCLLERDGRGGEAHREHLSRRQHRSRQRIEGDLRSHGYRRLGSHRRRQDQTFRIYAVLSRARARWSLHPDRSVLSDLESARVRHRHALHRTRRPDQFLHAQSRGRSAWLWPSTAGAEKA